MQFVAHTQPVCQRPAAPEPAQPPQAGAMPAVEAAWAAPQAVVLLEPDFAETGQAEAELAAFVEFVLSASMDSIIRQQLVELRRLTLKARQVEKAIHFMEGRQDAASSLPGEVERRVHSLAEQLRQSRAAGNKDAEAVAQAEWAHVRRGAVWQAFSPGCLSGLYRMACLPCRL